MNVDLVLEGKQTISSISERSLCNDCLQLIPYTMELIDDKVFLRKICPEHGMQSILISNDIPFYREAMNMRSSLYCEEAIKNVDKDLHIRSIHEKPYMLMIEVVDECNVGCPTCIANSKQGDGNFRKTAEIVDRVGRLTDRMGCLDLIMVTGGEPTIHPDIIEIITNIKKYSKQVMLITQGQRIAEDLEFVKSLAAIGDGFEVYLQFDSMRKEVLEELRGKDYRYLRQKAIENLSLYNIPTTLVCVIKKGLNDDELGEIVKFGIKYRNVRGITFQPIRSSGRNIEFCYNNHSITLTEIRRNLIDQLRLSPKALLSHPLNPEHLCIGYFSRNNFPYIEKTSQIFSPAGKHFPITSKVLYLTTEVCSSLFDDPTMFRIAIISFLDKYNFTTIYSRQCGIQFLTDDEILVSLNKKFIFTKID